MNIQGSQDLFPHLLSFSFFTVASYAVPPLNAKRDSHQKKKIFLHKLFMYSL